MLHILYQSQVRFFLIGYGVWRVDIGGREAWLVRVIIISLEIRSNRKVCVYLLHALHLCFPYQMNPYAINMTSSTSVATHISFLHASMIAHVQDPFSEFYLWSVCVNYCGTYKWLPHGLSIGSIIMISWWLQTQGGMDLGFRYKGPGLPSLLSCSSERSLSRKGSLRRPCRLFFLYTMLKDHPHHLHWHS